MGIREKQIKTEDICKYLKNKKVFCETKDGFKWSCFKISMRFIIVPLLRLYGGLGSQSCNPRVVGLGPNSCNKLAILSQVRLIMVLLTMATYLSLPNR